MKSDGTSSSTGSKSSVSVGLSIRQKACTNYYRAGVPGGIVLRSLRHLLVKMPAEARLHFA